MSNALVLREALASELPVLEEIRQEAFRPVFASFREMLGDEVYRIAQQPEDEGQQELLRSLLEKGSEWRVHVAERGAEVVGFVSFRLDPDRKVGEIGLNAVHPRHAGNGIGTKMFEFAIHTMKEEGMLVATVGTGGDPSHAAARRAYEKTGFDAVVPSVWMCKKL